MNILITAALSKELEPVRSYLISNFPMEKSVWFSFLKTGVGMKKAYSRLNEFIKTNSCDIIINVGTAGALNSALNLKEILLPTSFHAFQKETLKTIELSGSISALIPKLPSSWKRGSLYTSNTPVISSYQKNNISKTSDAVAVDMEAYALAEICYKNSIPFISLKVITDIADNTAITTFIGNLNHSIIVLKKSVKQLIECVFK
ncbi:MAG: hypothetical protein KAW56_11310 [Candidatus Marinimicrobia bacterium]|nr:hypothetical protein [Candidatus Neomarinimicrobiota bacterium]